MGKKKVKKNKRHKATTPTANNTNITTTNNKRITREEVRFFSAQAAISLQFWFGYRSNVC